MAHALLRREVLNAFKSLHRARITVFEGDEDALGFVREQINKNFRKNGSVEDENEIRELVKFSRDVETELRTTVVQARAVAPDRYQVRFSEETVRTDNVPYRDVPEKVLLACSQQGNKKSNKQKI